jgi:hypothetical protein
MLAKMIREEPETLKSMAEFTEPYGTLSAMDTIAEGDAGFMDYAAAIPVVGGIARAAKKGKVALDSMGDPVAAYRRTSSQPHVIKELDNELDFLQPGMDIDEFGEELALAGEAVSPETKRFLRQLDNNDWLGFDSPREAIRAVLTEDIDQFDVTPQLKQAIGALHNAKGGY